MGIGFELRSSLPSVDYQECGHERCDHGGGRAGHHLDAVVLGLLHDDRRERDIVVIL